MRTPDEVAAMLELKRRGWGAKRIAREFGTCPKTVRRYLRAGCWSSYARVGRPPALAGKEAWLEERLIRHGGNADVVRQELASEWYQPEPAHGRAGVHATTARLRAEARATMRFETPPGRQLQIDFGERRVLIGGVPVKVYLFVATLGFSRRLHVRAFRNEAQESWFSGMESAFEAFGGMTEDVLFDNARALVVRHDASTREVVFNARLHAFARHWGFRPRACAPYRARTKGKDERGVGYVKRNAVAGRASRAGRPSRRTLRPGRARLPTCASMARRARPPIERFRRAEAAAMRPIDGRPAVPASARVDAQGAVRLRGRGGRNAIRCRGD